MEFLNKMIYNTAIDYAKQINNPEIINLISKN